MTVGVIGGRGYVGRELVSLILRHPRLRLAFATSDSDAGGAISAVVPDAPPDLRFSALEDVTPNTPPPDALVLALGNNAAEEFLQSAGDWATGAKVILDVSADHRFAPDWTYGLPESFESQIAASTRIANPGCYATAMHLALRPLAQLGVTEAHCFGVSGYSGAGAAPNDRNNLESLRENILPYSLVGHGHEREASHHLGMPLRFAPSVAPFFRGLMVTAMVTLQRPTTVEAMCRVYSAHYADHPCVRVRGVSAPSIRSVVNTHFADVGALSVDAIDPRRIAVACAIDNLMKGAASQAIQNLNLALGFEPTDGLLP